MKKILGVIIGLSIVVFMYVVALGVNSEKHIVDGEVISKSSTQGNSFL